MNYLIAIVIGIVLAFIVAGVQKSALTSVEMQRAATEYLKRNTLKFSVKTDRFLYKRVERSEKPRK